MKYGCDVDGLYDCAAGLPRQGVVVQMWMVLDRGGAYKWAFGPVDTWCGSWSAAYKWASGPLDMVSRQTRVYLPG